MEIIFCGIDVTLCAAWKTALHSRSLPVKATVVQGDITSLEVDAVISPANSFGFMDGGVDLAYSHAFGWHVQARLQEKIKALPHNELLIGQALAVKTDDARIPWLISAPTMRAPCRLHDAMPVFLACRAATREAIRTGLSSVAFPGMGTGTGGVAYSLAAALMVKGIHEGIEGTAFPESLREVFALRSEFHTGFSPY